MISSIVYGPVPSRRLGRSLGINNIPPKRCSYSCVYCQLGRTAARQAGRKAFYEPPELARSAGGKVRQLREKGEIIDYVAFVPDGEPTLDINLGQEIDLLRALNIKIAVITNASLIWNKDVRENLQKADWVSLKVDAVNEETWRKVNRPHESLKLEMILQGMSEFARTFKGELTTETMLVKALNDNLVEITKIGDFLAKLKPSKAYLAVPIRPPAERVAPASETTINAAYHIFSERLRNVEYLIGYEGNAFAATGRAIDDLLSITAVHPMREDAVAELLKKSGISGWDIIRELIDNGSLVELQYQDKRFYARKLPGNNKYD